MATRQINIRLPLELIDEIDHLVKSGDFEDRAEFMKYALRKTIQSYNGRGKTFPLEEQEG